MPSSANRQEKDGISTNYCKNKVALPAVPSVDQHLQNRNKCETDLKREWKIGLIFHHPVPDIALVVGIKIKVIFLRFEGPLFVITAVTHPDITPRIPLPHLPAIKCTGETSTYLQDLPVTHHLPYTQIVFTPQPDPAPPVTQRILPFRPILQHGPGSLQTPFHSRVIGDQDP